MRRRGFLAAVGAVLVAVLPQWVVERRVRWFSVGDPVPQDILSVTGEGAAHFGTDVEVRRVGESHVVRPSRPMRNGEAMIVLSGEGATFDGCNRLVLDGQRDPNSTGVRQQIFWAALSVLLQLGGSR